ncbi:LIM/homeobox protein Lhx3 isoform X2 [Aphis craccivora]|uniref:LIM/homeobox protein Lhx3 isoform X2 n=1 Tax=Aphis craccivora TaxID=307492 RepID=A0A6G0ZD42_APHCR|nr:LIM/homeobox protein Lhx3 isoform X2 [Aphis craccivora]
MSTVLQQPPSGGAPQSSLLPHLHPHGHHGHHLHHRPAAELQAAAHNPDVLLALLARNKALEAGGFPRFDLQLKAFGKF